MVDYVPEQAVALFDPVTDLPYKAVTNAELIAALAGSPLSKGKRALVDVTLTVPTSGIANGDLLADTQVVTDLFRAIDVGGVLQSVTLIDPNNFTGAIDLVFLSDDVSLGTESAVASMSAANAINVIVANVHIVAGDYTSLGNAKVATIGNINKILKPKAGTRNGYIGAIMVTNAGQYASGTIICRLGIDQD